MVGCVSGVVDVEHIAKREKCAIRQVNRTVTLAFLAPRLIEAAVEGRLPRGIGVASLRDLPLEWSDQYQRLGLSLQDSALARTKIGQRLNRVLRGIDGEQGLECATAEHDALQDRRE